ncbi:unnamed protein product [Anisakis simplex]|uniref:Beta-glucuronidase (inferred by orthology to a human protein) n=1 Tax=Anisakis simplex TaxID=6269 RepID=A0A0M3J751_ANISI|nr:unnamed protein product [Anisakis simplex]
MNCIENNLVVFQEPSRDFSEQYQNDLLDRTHEAFDFLRMDNTIGGEMIWNFADFMTAQGVTRAVGNHKGVLTRTRQPKMAAYTMKRRYERLARQERIFALQQSNTMKQDWSSHLLAPSTSTTWPTTDATNIVEGLENEEDLVTTDRSISEDADLSGDTGRGVGLDMARGRETGTGSEDTGVL